MGRYCYSSSVGDFIKTSKEQWLDTMKTNFAENSTLPLDSSQINAWKDCYDVLQKVLPDFDSAHPGFAVIFEYQLPYESGRRPDVILLSEEQVIILEFKMKLAIYSADLDQCTAYGIMTSMITSLHRILQMISTRSSTITKMTTKMKTKHMMQLRIIGEIIIKRRAYGRTF